MKILLSLFFILSSFVYAGNYMSKAKLFDCEASGSITYTRTGDCSKSAIDCVEIPSGFNCKTHSEQDVQEDDESKPIYEDSESESCADMDECESIIVSKTCLDLFAAPQIIDEDGDLFLKCRKLIGFEQVTVQRILIDPAKKAVDDAAKAQVASDNLDQRNKRSSAKALMGKLKSGTDLTAEELRDVLVTMLKELRD